MSERTPSRIFLVGYRCSGKSTVGPMIASRLGWSYVDADLLLEERIGKSIARMFAEDGELAFRDQESQLLDELSKRESTVISTGGGSVLREQNRRIMRERGLVVWLNASAPLIWERMQADPATLQRRPNLTAKGDLNEVEELLKIREPLYREAAHATFDSDQSPERLADDIVHLCNGYSKSRS